jgi:hypothetical protein
MTGGPETVDSATRLQEGEGVAGVTGTDHRPEFAIPLIQPLWIEAKAARSDADGAIRGYAIAVGWDRPQKTTFYLVSDPNFSRPLWISEDEMTSNSIRPPSRP